MTSLLLLVAVPAQASPIKFADVVNVMGDLQKSSQIEQLRLRTVAQEPNGQTPSSASKSLAGPIAPAIDTDVQPAAAPEFDSDREDVLARYAYREFPARTMPTPRDEGP